MSPHLSPDAKAIVRAAEAMTAEVRRIADALTTPTTDPEDEWTGPLIPPILTDAIRAEQAEAGRVAADNMLRAVCAVFGGPHQDPVVKARETLARAERAEDAIEGIFIEDENPDERSLGFNEGLSQAIDELRRLGAEAQQDGHVYLSTGCLHDDHTYCKSMTGLNGAKRPAECKQCGAKCICPCHTEQATAEAQGGGPS